MASLRAKKELKRNDSPINILKALPKELLVEIVGKVASHSMADLCKVKLSCKEFLSASEDGYVYQHASMDNFALVPLPWFKSEKETSFLNRCKESGNLEILYREGMEQYFSNSNTLKVNLGLENLKKAALEDHHEAKYVYSMLLIMNFEGRKLGFDLFNELKNSLGFSVANCRNRVKNFIQSMWLRNHLVIPSQQWCCPNTCGSNGTKKIKKSAWLGNQVDNEVATVSCKYCDASNELALFFSMFRI